MDGQVEVQVALSVESPPPLSELYRWAKAALEVAGAEGALSIRIVGEEEGAELNAHWRGKQGPTNVLSFPSTMPEGLPGRALGDVVICAPVVAREAAEQGKAPDAHWAHMVVHGVLHLAGHDHEDDAGAARMESLEAGILAGLGYPDPYEAGAANE